MVRKAKEPGGSVFEKLDMTRAPSPLPATRAQPQCPSREYSRGNVYTHDAGSILYCQDCRCENQRVAAWCKGWGEAGKAYAAVYCLVTAFRKSTSVKCYTSETWTWCRRHVGLSRGFDVDLK